MLGRAVVGMALIAADSVSEGMRNLDEVNAAVIGGEVTDRVTIGLCGCYLIAACERVRDYERALQWCSRLKEFCAKWGLRPFLPCAARSMPQFACGGARGPKRSMNFVRQAMNLQRAGQR